MRKIVFIISFIVLSLQIITAQSPWESWEKDIIKKANTAAGNNFMDDEEKKVILISNLARYDGKLFAETFLKDYLNNNKSTSYTRSLEKDLKKIKNYPFLQIEDDLFKIAREHAKISGKRSTTGHQRFKKRFDPVMGKYTSVAENCAYGYNEAVIIVIKLLVDEDITNLGHRKNLLNKNFNSVGVAIRPHKKYGTNCVIDFATKR